MRATLPSACSVGKISRDPRVGHALAGKLASCPYQTFHLIKHRGADSRLAFATGGYCRLRTMQFDKKRQGSISRPLEQQIRQALKDKGQVILLLNRRGYSTHIQCPACGVVLRCPECDIALTHHRDLEQAICHYCDFSSPGTSTVPRLRVRGDPVLRFWHAKAGSGGPSSFSIQSLFAYGLGLDETAWKSRGWRLTKFRKGEVDILLGTQMIAKGLDFPNVTLVGVINADTALHLPDFARRNGPFS